MTRDAANCLLKTLEEPPKYAIIILITNNKESLLDTIKSRCEIIKFTPIPMQEVASYLTMNGIDSKRASLLANFSRGSMKKAIELSESEEFHLMREEVQKYVETFLNGNWEKLGTDDLNFTKVVTEKEVKDSDGKVIGRYLQASNSVIGKLLGKFYYLHPANFIRGVFLEGDLLLKLASRKNGELNKKSFAYLLYNARLGKVFSAFAKPMKILSSKFAIMINPLFVGIKNFVRGVLRRILGATGLGGWLLMKIMDLIGDRITYLMNQIVLILLLGVIGLLFVFLESTGLLYSNQKASVIQGVNSVSDIVISGEYFTDEDFVLPEFEK